MRAIACLTMSRFLYFQNPSHAQSTIRWIPQLGVGGLVKQLREPGVNGAPLLFQAATNSRCFHAVKKVRALRYARAGDRRLQPPHVSRSRSSEPYHSLPKIWRPCVLLLIIIVSYNPNGTYFCGRKGNTIRAQLVDHLQL